MIWLGSQGFSRSHEARPHMSGLDAWGMASKTYWKQGRRGTSSLQAIVTLEQRLTTNPNEAIRSSWVVEKSSHIAATGQTLNRGDSASQVEWRLTRNVFASQIGRVCRVMARSRPMVQSEVLIQDRMSGDQEGLGMSKVGHRTRNDCHPRGPR